MKNVEDIYPLSPIQQGMLFHTLYAPKAGMYLEQKLFTLTGNLNVPALQQAWQRVIDRHPALRTVFLWQGLDEPMQIVRKTVSLAWHVEDWRALSESDQHAKMTTFLQEDRAIGLDLTKAPLMRMALFRTGEDVYEFMWMHHHILIDGWSLPLIFKEVLAFYEAFSQGQELQLPQSRPYREYIAWLKKQDMAKAEQFWRQELQGFTTPTPLGNTRNGQPQAVDEDIYGEAHALIPEEDSQALQSIGRQHQITLNTIFQATWGLLLGHLSNSQDVVFGATVSGRPTDLMGVEAVVGLFINTLPVRVKTTPETSIIPWLKDLQAHQVEVRAFEYSPLAQVQGWSDIPRGQPLFHSFFVFDNYPVELGSSNDDGPGISLAINNLRALEKGNYPLVVKARVAPGVGIALGTMHDYSHFDDTAATRLLKQLELLLKEMAAQPDATLGQLLQPIIDMERKEKMAVKRKRKEVNLNNFMSVTPTAVNISQTELVKTDYLNDEQYPLVIQPAVPDVDLADWASSNMDYLEREVTKHGAILFRGFGVDSVPAFESFARSICPDLYGDYGDLPKEEKGEKVYHSTPYPEDKTILFHNESSHMHRWPMKQMFFCQIPSEQGGETPIVDCRKMYQRLDPKIIENFQQRNLRYVRNFIEGLDVSWQQFFRTDDRAIVEAYCRSNSIEFEWTGENDLRTYQISPGVAKHPKTGEDTFFNQVQLHHVYFLDPELRQSVETLFSAEEYPRNVHYGDGTPIEDSIMEEISQMYWDTSVSFTWQTGDIVLVDNMITAHARNPYKGKRKIVVAMGEIMTLQEAVGAEAMAV